MSFRGTYTALATPFLSGAVDQEAFARLIEFQIQANVDGIVPVGTTGESPTLSHEEHREVIRLAVKYAAGRCPVIAGAGSNCTEEAVALTTEAERLGANGALHVAPYYNRPSQEGLFRHFQAIADSVKIPIVLYSIPGRCGVEIGVETTVRLAETCPNIRCIKEAGGNVERVSQLRSALPPDFVILSGDDSLTLPFLSAGAEGVISVASNLIPAEVAQLVGAWRAQDINTAQKMHRRLYPLFKDLFVESNPVPLKHALTLNKIINSSEVRLPLVELSESSRTRLENTLRSLDLLP